MATWNPFGVEMNITATAETVTRISATQFTVKMKVSWACTGSSNKTDYGMKATSGGDSVTINAEGTNRNSASGYLTGTYTVSKNVAETKTITVKFENFNKWHDDSATKEITLSVNVKAWTSYTVSYNANGGTGAPSSQTKWKDQILTLSGTKPTRTNYTFLGWNVSSSATVATYSAGGNYTENKGATLYAVWEISYQKPRITNVTVCRAVKNADDTFTESDEGNYIQATFRVSCDGNNPTVQFSRKLATDPDVDDKWITTYELPLTTNDVEVWHFGSGTIDPEKSYDVKIIIKDSGGSTEKSTTIPSVEFPIDALPKSSDSEKAGVAFGKVAELPGVAEFAYEGKFNSPVYGKALGMDRLPAIPSNSDFNNYMETGCYAVQSNAIAATCSHIPIARAGRLEVWSATGEGVRAAQWSYLRQRYIPYNSDNAVWERDIARNADNVWSYYDWWRSSLTPEASKNVYSKAAITACTGSSITKSATGETQIPLTKSTTVGNGLTLSSNAIVIGQDITAVEISAAGMINCASASSNSAKNLIIKKNGTEVAISMNSSWSTSKANFQLNVSPKIITVGTGDSITFHWYASTSDVLSNAEARTYITVKTL